MTQSEAMNFLYEIGFEIQVWSAQEGCLMMYTTFPFVYAFVRPNGTTFIFFDPNGLHYVFSVRKASQFLALHGTMYQEMKELKIALDSIFQPTLLDRIQNLFTI